jgi:hypothetical protein
MKFVKMVAVCAVVALGVSASSAMAGSVTTPNYRYGYSSMRYDRVVGSCDNGRSGVAAVAGGMAYLWVPTQMSWAQIRAYPQDVKLSELDRLSFRSNASHRGIVYMKITTAEGNHSILYSPNTQPGVEQGVGTWATHNVLAGTVRLDDDAGSNPDITWSQVLAAVGNTHIKDVRVTAGCANPVGSYGGLVGLDDLTINNKVHGFNWTFGLTF